EFQSHVDFIVILPLLTVWSVVTIDRLMQVVRLPVWLWIAGIALYSLGDIPWMRPGITLQQQQAWVASIVEAYPDRELVASRASQVHVLLERQMPLKYIRYHAAEEVVVEMEGGCDVLGEQLAALPDWLLIVRRTRPSHLHSCAADAFDARCETTPVMTFREPASMIPIPRLVSWHAVYDVHLCETGATSAPAH
ncbi:MAG: hypothetical protein R3330_07715, partial [Saprospiraceae bacterium]|nr:hypothetical protein [Saprospiraceae bacterium]